MITKAVALQTMQRTDGNGKRVSFSIAYLTANRALWHNKKKLIARYAALPADSPEREVLQVKINSINAGGKLVQHHDCVLSGVRGIHAANSNLSKNAAPNPNTKRPRHSLNRTRNIQFLPGKHIRKLHNSLIMQLNNTPVLY